MMLQSHGAGVSPPGLFVRYGLRPRSDLRRNYSRPWGETTERHAGLSGYDVGLEEALRKLVEYFAGRGGWDPRGFVSVYSGVEVGTGPDLESLFRAKQLVASVRANQEAELDDEVATDLRDRLVAAEPSLAEA